VLSLRESTPFRGAKGDYRQSEKPNPRASIPAAGRAEKADHITPVRIAVALTEPARFLVGAAANQLRLRGKLLRLILFTNENDEAIVLSQNHGAPPPPGTTASRETCRPHACPLHACR